MKDERGEFWLRVCAAGATIGAVGCQGADVSDLFAFRRGPAMDDLTIRTADGHAFRGDPAMIEVVAPLEKGPSAKASVALSTIDRSGYGLSIAFDLSVDALLAHSFAVDIGESAEAATFAHLSREGAELVGSGVVMLDASAGKLRGQFRTTDATFASGTIDGIYSVSCFVPPEMLGEAPNGQTSEGSWLLIEDERKTSPFCQQFSGF